jgi:hypothetical protein
MPIDRLPSGAPSCSIPITIRGLNPAQVQHEPPQPHGRPLPPVEPTTRPWLAESAAVQERICRQRRQAMDQADASHRRGRAPGTRTPGPAER